MEFQPVTKLEMGKVIVAKVPTVLFTLVLSRSLLQFGMPCFEASNVSERKLKNAKVVYIFQSKLFCLSVDSAAE